MSLGYAEKLSYREDLGGQLGAPEIYDDSNDLNAKIQQLTEWVQASNNIVCFTGAGISTACGIPDFRGPKGVWTLQRTKKPLPKLKCSFTVARPSLTHMALVGLVQSGKVRYVVSQNVDGLHLRSGIPRQQLAELHGNCFAEHCPKCRKEYIRDFEIETVGFKVTGRVCSEEGCTGRLKDHILDWEDALPEDELEASEHAASEADLAICLGTSLQITPACNLPLRTLKAGGKLVIVNLQPTPKDKKASLVIHGRTDEVMRGVMEGLRMPIPKYMRQDAVLLVSSQERPSRKGHTWDFVVSSVHGRRCPLPLVQSVDVKLPEHSSLRPATLRSHPFEVRRTVEAPGPLPVSITLHLVDAVDADKQTVAVKYTAQIRPAAYFDEQGLSNGSAGTGNKRKRGKDVLVQQELVTFKTQEVQYEANPS